MSKLNISKGRWKVLKEVGYDPDVVTGDDNVAWTGFSSSTEEEKEANATLIADAGNTYSKCGMLPSELLKGVDNGNKWFNSYQSVDNFLFNELDILDLEFPIIDEDKPELNTIEAIKVLIKEIVRLNKLKTK